MNTLLRYVKTVPFGIWLITCAHATTDIASGALYVALPFFKAKFGLGYAEVAAIVLLQNLTASVSQPIFGYLSDKKSRLWWMPLGCLITGVAMLTALLVPIYPLVLLCTVISGFGGAIFHPEGAKTVNRLSGKATGKGASLFAVGGNVGFAIGAVFLGTLLLGNPAFIYVFALPNITISVLLLLVMKQLIPQQEIKQGGVARAKLAIDISLPLLALLGVVFIRAVLSSGVTTFVPLYYTSFLHGNSAYAVYSLSIYLTAGAAGTLLGGPLSDRYGSKRVMLYSILPVSVLLYFFKVLGGVWPFVFLAIISILLSATFTGSLVMAQKMMPNNVAMASGLTLGFGIGLGGMGVMALGHVADVSGLPWVFNLLSILPLIGFVLTFFVPKLEVAGEGRPVAECK